MKLNKGMVKIIQQMLNEELKQNLTVDGDPGRKTMSALDQITSIPNHWEQKRRLVGYLQHTCIRKGINTGRIDGFWGDMTEYGYENLKAKINTGHILPSWRFDQGEGNVQGQWPIETPENLDQFFGQPGENQTLITLPYEMRLAWAPHKTINKISCHKLIAEPVVRVLEKVLDHYGDDISMLGLDLFGGCYNKRKIRGGTRWSTHAYAISLDFDTARNKLRWDDSKANFAKPIYTKWFDLWEEEGAISLGREKNFDWQHIQFCRRK